VRRVPKLKKRSGREEEFDRTKLERSLRNAGVTEETARKIAEGITPREGMATSEMRMQAITQLKSHNPETSKRYENTRTIVARAGAGVPKNTARLHEETLKALGVKAGATLELAHAGKTHRVKVEASSINQREIHLLEETLRTIGAPEGTKVAVRLT